MYAKNNPCVSLNNCRYQRLSSAYRGKMKQLKFGRREHFALRRKVLNPPIARLPAI